ncbi:hypothetical protein [Plastoroseomonas arctica]|uniref:PepSY domain-containing protein n=1 Tax=Plastoroseomonas arctica TaxID=1509237 RepID=A0AAF1K536_9PROT|nr:hypothetical protein [Plastoroseomonas arctica]MBR0656823.1 PepSY domain-containing protein [Plastoroseomonas arctica]
MRSGIGAFALAGITIVALGGGVFAQAPQPPRDPAPLAGANSFTERQARSRLIDAGFAMITGLSLGQDGVWRGRAMRNGTTDDVAMDFRGDVFVGAAARAPEAPSPAESPARGGTRP